MPRCCVAVRHIINSGELNLPMMMPYTLQSSKGAPIPGICIGIGPIPAFFGGMGIGQVCYTSTNSIVCAILSMK